MFQSTDSTDLVVLKNGKLDLLPLVLDFLGGGVVLLLTLLAATPEEKKGSNIGI